MEAKDLIKALNIFIQEEGDISHVLPKKTFILQETTESNKAFPLLKRKIAKLWLINLNKGDKRLVQEYTIQGSDENEILYKLNEIVLFDLFKNINKYKSLILEDEVNKN